MATLLSSLLTQVRAHLNESTESFWSDAELLSHLNNGIKDLWRAINDNYQDYFLTLDITNVTLAANATTASGVPSDVSVVRLIGPRDRATYPYLTMESRSLDHPDFIAAQAQSAIDPSSLRLMYFWVSQAGAPVGAPTIHMAPTISASLPLQLGYVPTVPAKASTDSNPIPGESDQALINWTLAYGLAKQREDQQPDTGWLTMYATEKANILKAISPRQTQDVEVAEAVFEDWW